VRPTPEPIDFNHELFPIACHQLPVTRRTLRKQLTTIGAHWVVPALLRSVPLRGRVLEPAAGRGHLSLELRRVGLEVASFDHRHYADPLVPDIEQGDIRRLTTLEGFAWVVTNLPYGDLEELATHLIGLGVRDHCGVALLVRAEWIVPKARRKRVHEHPHFAGAVMLTARPRWVERAQDSASPRHNFAWGVWGAAPRVGDPWLRFAGREGVEANYASAEASRQ
jgi:hypothetical protein